MSLLFVMLALGQASATEPAETEAVGRCNDTTAELFIEFGFPVCTIVAPEEETTYEWPRVVSGEHVCDKGELVLMKMGSDFCEVAASLVGEPGPCAVSDAQVCVSTGVSDPVTSGGSADCRATVTRTCEPEEE